MKNKFKVLFNTKEVCSTETQDLCLLEPYCLIKFVFSSTDINANVITENANEYQVVSRNNWSSGNWTSGQIVKSDIKESVVIQLKKMFNDIKNDNKQLVCLKMNKGTQNKFRTSYSYEVSYVPKDSDQSMGKVIGSIMGVKIVEDATLDKNVVMPIVKNIARKTERSKFYKIFQN